MQDKKIKSGIFHWCFFPKGRKGISVMVGYILLVGFVILMGIGVYAWLKTYVPSETLICDDGSSLFIKSYDCGSGYFNITLKNNGRFNIGGFFIHITNDSEKDLAVIDISEEITDGGVFINNAIWFTSSEVNSLEPNEELDVEFDTTGYGVIYGVEIIPIRFQEVENKIRLIGCGEAKIQAEVDC